MDDAKQQPRTASTAARGKDNSPRRFQQSSMVPSAQECQVSGTESKQSGPSESPTAPQQQPSNDETGAVQWAQSADIDESAQGHLALRKAAITPSQSGLPEQDAVEKQPPRPTLRARQTLSMPSVVQAPAITSSQPSWPKHNALEKQSPHPTPAQQAPTMPSVVQATVQPCQHAGKPPRPGGSALQLKPVGPAGCNDMTAGVSAPLVQEKQEPDERKVQGSRAAGKVMRGTPGSRPGWSIAKLGTLQGRQRPERPKQAPGPVHPKQVGPADQYSEFCHGRPPAAFQNLCMSLDALRLAVAHGELQTSHQASLSADEGLCTACHCMSAV